MEFVTEELSRSSSFSPHPSPQRNKSKNSVELDAQVEENSLRSRYQQAVQVHFQSDYLSACALYDSLLHSPLLHATSLLASASQLRDAYEEGVASTKSRLTLRYLTLKNRGKIEEQLVRIKQESNGNNTNEATSYTSSSSSSTHSHTPTISSFSSSSSSSDASASLLHQASVERALHFYIQSVEMASALATLQLNLEQGEEMDHDASNADGSGASGGVGGGVVLDSTMIEFASAPSSSSSGLKQTNQQVLVTDIVLWQAIARTAWKCHQYSVVRYAIESAFKLQPDDLQIVDKLIDLLYVCSDYFLLWSLLQHACKQLQTGGGQLVTLTTTTTHASTSASASTSTSTCASSSSVASTKSSSIKVNFALKVEILQLQLLSWNIPDEQTRFTQEFQQLHERIYGMSFDEKRKGLPQPPHHHHQLKQKQSDNSTISSNNSKRKEMIESIESYFKCLKEDYAAHAAEANDVCTQRLIAPAALIVIE